MLASAIATTRLRPVALARDRLSLGFEVRALGVVRKDELERGEQLGKTEVVAFQLRVKRFTGTGG